ncbi:MAG TPA: dihydrodipicolinate synthase family protein, partial [Clostridia bacterium]|nr:dihydrodipicolinate synthase family protein [Clostridia bacterium]
MRKAYHGVIPPFITPVDAKERVDEEGFRALLEDGINRGLHGIFVAGTNGECMALTQAERNRAIRISVDQAAGRVPVLAGVMDSSTTRVIENIKALEGVGIRCAVVTSIFYARHSSQEETVRHFERIGRETDMDLIVYNMPSMTGLTLSPATVLRLSKLERVVGYKDSSPAYAGFMQVLAQLRDTPFAC